MRRGNRREQEALAGEVGADLLALEVVQVAGQPDAHDQVVAIALAGRDQARQLPGDGDRVGLAGAAVLADLAGQQCAASERDQPAGLALLGAQALAAVRAMLPLSNEIDAWRSSADEGGASDRVAAPAGLAGLFQQQGQCAPEPPFLPLARSSKRSKTACT